ncbi:unnamed protein product [Agarophyton chilense]|eukprot:gb/GEZJ01004785.1/.p1 GENE.gb/GEZJ01004785.1/~~gb/GEZJ01004785.1/.p1  ORF type:complete len:2142 (+),score=227.50 gb/GEZJ01004785.1/:372-6797(+)
MRRDHAASFSFVSLCARLRSARLTRAELKSILEEHKDDLLRAVNTQQSVKTAGLSFVRYRRNAAETADFPRPTDAELDFIPSIEKELDLSQYDAALLLRDYLGYTNADDVSDILRSRTDLSVVVSIQAVKKFWKTQKRAAFSALTTILTLSRKEEGHVFCDQFSEFVLSNKKAMQAIIVSSVIAVLEARKNESSSTTITGIVEHWWVMDSFFAFSVIAGLDIQSKAQILSKFAELVKARKNPLTHSDETPSMSNAIIDGGEGTILFVAALNWTNDLSSITYPGDPSDDAMVEDVERSLSKKEQSDLEMLNNLYGSLQIAPFAENALLCLSWSSRVQFYTTYCKKKGSAATVMDPNAGTHMAYSLGTNVFRILQDISRMVVEISESLEAYLFRCYWDDLAAFLTMFPPTNFTSSQVAELVQLSSAVLTRSGESACIDVAEALWRGMDTGLEQKGINVLLALASGIFPLSYLPLVKLLSVLVIDKKSAAHATYYLENCLETVTEVSDGYRNALVVIDEKPEHVWESLAAQRGAEVNRLASTFLMVRPAEGDITFVQCSTDLPADRYRSALPRGSVGIGSLAHSVVTWLCPFNGLDAVLYIIDMLRRLLVEDDLALSSDDAVVEELVSSGLVSMNLIDRLCRKASSVLHGHITKDLQLSGLIARIFGELADPSERILNSWLSKDRHELLLTASASCLASIAIGSRDCAVIALEHLESAQRGLPLQTAMASLGEGAFPALAAISRVTDAWSATGSSSERLMDVLRTASQSPRQRALWEFLERFRGSQKKIHDFLASTALPLWLTTPRYESTLRQPAELHWLLPACSLQFFSCRPDLLLRESTVCAVFGELVTSCYKLKVLEESDTFLFPALYAGLTACVEALQLRNGALQAKRDKDSNGPLENEAPTLLERVLLSPEVTFALTMIASGNVDILSSVEFYKRWERSHFKHLLSDIDRDRLLSLTGATEAVDGQYISSWPSRIADMSARCLSLQYSCLAQTPRNGSTIQAPWPSRHRSALGFWRGGGDTICKGFAGRIQQERSIASIELLMNILSCGQRAAARSLMGPRRRTETLSQKSPKRRSVRFSVPGKNGSTGKDGDKAAEKDGNPSPRNTDTGDVGLKEDEAFEIFRAVIECLSNSQEEFVASMRENRLPDIEDEHHPSIVLGHVSLCMAACVRFLRVGRESHYSNWFQKCWDQLSVWKVLSNMLKCSGSPSKPAEGLDLAEAVSVPYNTLDISEIEKAHEKLQLNPSLIDTVLREIRMSVDVASIWKSIAADVLLLFCGDISETSTTLSDSKGENMNYDKGKKIRESLTLFAAVFTERWMHVLLDVDGSFTSRPFKELRNIPVYASREESPKKRRTNDRVVSEETEIHSILRDFSTLVGLSNSTVHGSHLLNQCRRSGDTQMRYGAEYAFDVHKVRRFLHIFDVPQQSAFELLIRIIRLNIVLTRRDVQVDVTSSFCAISVVALQADSSPPGQASGASSQLTYTSPQFSGKLCRFLSRSLVCLSPPPGSSAHTLAIASDFSKLMMSLSARLTKDELTVPVLTKITFCNPPSDKARECAMTPVSQICSFVSTLLRGLKGKRDKGYQTKNGVVRWLLLSAGRLLKGLAFSEAKDGQLLYTTALLALEKARGVPKVNTAAAVALFSVMEIGEKRGGEAVSNLFNDEALSLIFSSISSLDYSCNKGDRNDCCEATANLMLIVARARFSPQESFNLSANSFALRQICRGSVQAFLPPPSSAILTYDFRGESRDPIHQVWCSSLHLASVVIPTEEEVGAHMLDKETLSKDVLEFCSTNLSRITQDSLDLHGDWPRETEAPGTTVYGSRGSLRHLTIARIEEAELAAMTLMKLSSFAVELKDKLPDLTHDALRALSQFVSRVIRLLRAEPLERWVRPVTKREKERSHLLRVDKDYVPSRTDVLYRSSSTPTSPIPSYGGKRTPPKRSPSQAVREALGGFRMGQNPYPPSPVSSTPRLSLSPDLELSSSLSLSGWEITDPGLITKGDLSFGAEASRSLLRALSAAVCALRKFSTALDTMFFRANMSSYEDPPGIGVLMSILSYTCSELRLRADSERREHLISLMENGMNLLITHTLGYEEQGELYQGVRDELRSRTTTLLSRVSRIKPPLPQDTLVQNPLVKNFLHSLR